MSGTATCPTCGPASSTATASTARTSRRNGHRFNPNKVLLDPYAKAIGRDRARGTTRCSATRSATRTADLSFDDARQRRRSPRWPRSSTRRSPGATTGRRARRGTRRSSTSCTSRASPSCIPACPSSCAAPTPALATEPAIEHLQKLGVTAVELLPVHHHVDDRHLVERGLTQLLGLQHARLLRARRRATPRRHRRATRCASSRRWCGRCTRPGIEVILDVVYNHTAEGNQLGPTLSLRGIDNAAYYRLLPDDPRYYMDFTGCGNTLNMQHPQVLQLIMDSLRYWVLEMHVDGFRFDLASTLARELYEVDRLGAFFDIIHQDPVLSQVKLIAEPWDVGAGRLPGRQLPRAVDRVERQVPRQRARVLEGRRRHVVGAGHAAGRQQRPVRARAAGGRTPASTSSPATTASRCTTWSATTRSTTRPTARTTATAQTTTTSWNCGVEGPTDDPAIIALRERQKRNLLATLLLSQGVPMICGGDETRPHAAAATTTPTARTTSSRWLDWDLDDRAARVPRVHQPARSASAASSRSCSAASSSRAAPIRGADVKDISWLEPERQRDDRRELERRLRPVPRRAAGRRRHRRSGRARASRSSATRC